MASDTTLSTLLAKLTSSLTSTLPVLPASQSLTPPANGISLLSTKNDLLLSYLHHLVFLLLLRIRAQKESPPTENDPSSPSHADVAAKLAELRVWLERGVRPLEGRLKYQIDKVLRAADADAVSAKTQARGEKPTKRAEDNADGHAPSNASDSSSSSEDDDEDEDEEEEETTPIDPLSHRPNPAALLRSRAAVSAAPTTSSSAHRRATSPDANASAGPYRPPRITPLAPPSPPSSRRQRAPPRSAALDDYIATEVSGAPVAEPSVGSAIVGSGRREKSARERREEEERRGYEEENFVRLPEVKRKAERKRGMEFGGEEWAGLGAGVERVLGGGGGGGGTGKRKGGGERWTEDGPRGEGFDGGRKRRRGGGGGGGGARGRGRGKRR